MAHFLKKLPVRPRLPFVYTKVHWEITVEKSSGSVDNTIVINYNAKKRYLKRPILLSNFAVKYDYLRTILNQLLSRN